MRQFLTQYLKDFKANFVSLNAYIILGGYCILSLFSAIYFGDYFLRESEILNSYFVMQPIILMLVIPAVTMRTWADEIKSGTLELLLTQPISYTKLVLAKFAAAYTFFLLMILFTLPFYFISDQFSVLDYGATNLGYAGLLLCGALFTIIGCLVSVFNRNIILSYISTIFVIFLITQVQFDAFIFKGSVISLRCLNFEDNFVAFLGGVFYLGNLIYFLLGIILFTWLNVVVLAHYRLSPKTEIKKVIFFALLLLMIFSSTTLGSSLIFDTPVDLTDEHRFTLTPESKKFLATTDKKIDISLYESKNKREDANSSYAVYADFVERILKLIERTSKGAVRTDFIRVEPFSAQERSLVHDNISFEEDNLGNKNFLAADFSDNEGNHALINSFKNLRQNLLEADILRVIHRFGQPQKKVAVIADNEDLTQMSAFLALLEQFYALDYLSSAATFIPPTYDGVIIINPLSLSSEFLLAMEQYVLNGGSLIIFADPDIPLGSRKVFKNFLPHFGITPDFDKIATFDDQHETDNFGFAVPFFDTDNKWKDIRSVLINKAGTLNVKSAKDYAVSPILSVNEQIIAAESSGKFVSDHIILAAQTEAVEPVSVKDGKLIFFFDTDMLKDYLYVSEETKHNTFYDTIPVADNMLLFLRLMAFATGESAENNLTYRHYAVNLSSIGNTILRGIKERYAEQTNALQKQIDTYSEKENKLKNVLTQKGYASVRNIGNLSDMAQRLEEAQDNLNKLKAAILNEYQTIIATLTLILVLVIPFLLLLLMALILTVCKKIKSQKIRRLIQNASSY